MTNILLALICISTLANLFAISDLVTANKKLAKIVHDFKVKLSAGEVSEKTLQETEKIAEDLKKLSNQQ